MSTLKMFRFSVENMTTREHAKFIGQGESIAAAISDGLKGVQDTFRPKNDGKQRDPMGLAVTLPSGEIVNRKLQDFEGDVPWAAPVDNELDFPV